MEACALHNDKKETGDTWKDRVFIKNCILYGKHSISAMGHLLYLLLQRVEKPNNMTPKDFIAWFEVLFQLYNNIKADNELTIRKKEKSILFFNVYTVEHWNTFVKQQEQYHKMTMEDFEAHMLVHQLPSRIVQSIVTGKVDVTSAQEANLFIVMIADVTSEAKIIMLKLEINQGQFTTMATTSMTTLEDRSRKKSPSLSFGLKRIVQHSLLEKVYSDSHDYCAKESKRTMIEGREVQKLI